MTGSISEVSSTSRFRRLSRRLRPTMAPTWVIIVGVLILSPSTGSARVISDMDGLLVGLIRGPSGQGQEDVVEGGLMNGEGAHPARARVDLVQQSPDLRRAAVGRQAHRPAARIGADQPAAEQPADVIEGRRIGQGEIQSLIGDLVLQL